MSTASVVNICNMALGWIGGDRITSLGDDSTRANLCNLNYPRSRDVVLEAREWTFAVKHQLLSPDAAAPSNPEYGQRFFIPTDILRVLTVHQPVDFGADQLTAGLIQAEQIPWVREGRYILCNFDEVSMRGIQRIESTGEFSESFVHALSARLAADLAIPLTESKELQQQMYSLYLEKLDDASATDGMQGRSQRIRSRYLQSRR